MRHSMLATIAALGAAAALSACATDGYYAGGPYGGVGFDAYYDGFYGPYYGGYWGPDGGFYYYTDSGHRHWRRDEGNHFHHEGGHGMRHVRGDHAPGGGDGHRDRRGGR